MILSCLAVVGILTARVVAVGCRREIETKNILCNTCCLVYFDPWSLIIIASLQEGAMFVGLRAGVSGPSISREKCQEHGSKQPTSIIREGSFQQFSGRWMVLSHSFCRWRIFLLVGAGSPIGGTVRFPEIDNRSSGGNGRNSISAMMNPASHL